MQYSPPPLFKQGAPARVKVTVFAIIAIALLVIDARINALTAIRQVAGTVLYPLQMAALMPRDAVSSMGGYFSSLSALQREVHELKSQQVANAQAMQYAQLQMAENAQLRRLMDARQHLPVQSIMGEILYDARDPSTRKIVLDRGTRNGVEVGLPVIDNAGVVGQVTRVFPFTSEVTLLTDKEQAIPVQVLRSGLRSVAYGRGHSGLLDLRFVAPNADIQVGDVLVTSGLDGVYPAGLAVAKVAQVESVGAGAFGRVVCQPLAGIDRNRQLLIVTTKPQLAPRPPAETLLPAHSGRRKLPKMAPIALPPLAPPAAAAQPPASAAVAAAAARPAPGAAARPAPAAAAPPAPSGAAAPVRTTPPAPARATPGARVPAPTSLGPAPAVAAATATIDPAKPKEGAS
jgi:rod shape-determining protein MreC